MFTVEDPLRTLSIVEPTKPGGCSQRQDIREDFRVPVQVTAARHNCSVAINAGFFNVHSGKCYGNLVSDGYVVQTGPPNVNFGIRKSGKIEIGYINATAVKENDKADDPFLQLIAGVLWLVRDGKPYVNTSMSLEYNSTQGGTLKEFRRFLSARVAIGHDKHGVVKVVQVDGKTWNRGLDLDQFAELLIGMGLVNAINLDGGGSSTSVVNGSVVSASSEDACKHDPPMACPDCNQDLQQLKVYCERPVTTVVCLKDPSSFITDSSADRANIESGSKTKSRLIYMEDAAKHMTTGMIIAVALCCFSIILNLVQCGCCARCLPADAREDGGFAGRQRSGRSSSVGGQKSFGMRGQGRLRGSPFGKSLAEAGDSLIESESSMWHEVDISNRSSPALSPI